MSAADQVNRHDAIVVTSDTDSEEEDLLDMVSQISSLISCQRDEDHIGISQDPAPKSRLSTVRSSTVPPD